MSKHYLNCPVCSEDHSVRMKKRKPVCLLAPPLEDMVLEWRCDFCKGIFVISKNDYERKAS